MNTPSANKTILSLNPYQPGAPISEIARKFGVEEDDICKLASNESPYGPSAAVIESIRAALDNLQLYPDQYDLIEAISKHHSVEPDTIIVGNGSNDVLDLIARTYLDVGSEAIAYEHSFLVYKIATTAVGADFIETKALEYGYNLEEMLDKINEKTRVIWIDNPNNPTGTFIKHNHIKNFLQKVPSKVLVVLDEAYWDYLPDEVRTDTVRLIQEFPNLIITRTFSKIHGLAALRIGYAIGHSKVIEPMNRLRQPFNVNSLGITAAVTSLNNQKYIKKVRENSLAEAKTLMRGLEELGLEYIPSYANFITVRFDSSDMVYQQLLERGLIIRPVANYGLAKYLRITIGTGEENEKLLTALTEICTNSK